MNEIQPGARLMVRTADDRWVPRRALSWVEPGHSFPVVWVCREEDYATALTNPTPYEIPWPADAVRLATDSEPTSE